MRAGLDAMRARFSGEAVLVDQLQPFSPPAAQVQYRTVGGNGSRAANVIKVNSYSFLDHFTAAAELILKCNVKGIKLMLVGRHWCVLGRRRGAFSRRGGEFH